MQIIFNMSGSNAQQVHDQSPHISCGKHPVEIYTNYCCTTLTPLCPDCIDSHNKTQKANGILPEVDTLGRVKYMCGNHVEYAISMLEGELKTVIQHQNFTVGDWLSLARTNLEAAKKKMLEIINVYFADLLKRYQDELGSIEGRFNFKPIRDDLETIVKELKLIQNQLKGPQVFQGIKSTVTLDMKALVKTYQTKVEDALDVSHNIPIDVDFSDEDARDFQNKLRDYISLNNRNVSLNRDPNSRNRIQKTEIDLHNRDTSQYLRTKFKINN